MKALLFLATLSLQPVTDNPLRPDRAPPPRFDVPELPCLRAPEPSKHVTWVIRDRDGHIRDVGAQDVRQRC